MFAAWKLVVTGIVLAAGIFSAQAPNRLASEGEWFVECAVDRVTNKRDCEVAVEVKSPDPSYHFAFMYRVESRTFLAVGLPAPSRVVARVDQGAPYSVGMCTGQACVLRGRIASELRDHMHKGSVLQLEFHGPAAVGVFTEVSLNGFSSMYLQALDRLSH